MTQQEKVNLATYILFIAVGVAAIIYGAVTGGVCYIAFGVVAVVGTILCVIIGANAYNGVLRIPFWLVVVIGVLLIAVIVICSLV